jgi:hypothetical protein
MQTMWQRNRATAGFAVSLAVSLIVVIAPLAGCDSWTAVNEVPEQSKKALIQRKVDVTPGKAKSSRAGGPPTKGRASGR